MGNLLCGFYVTKDNQFYMTSGQDGQIEKLDWDGTVLGVSGKGPGKGNGQFGEAHYMAMDAKGDIYVADTVNGRVTKSVVSEIRRRILEPLLDFYRGVFSLASNSFKSCRLNFHSKGLAAASQ